MRATSLVCVALLAVALVSGGCKRHRSETGPGQLRPVVMMGDPQAASQLLSGFHSIEEGVWRWTARQFSIALACPPNADRRGATLTVKLTVPPVSIEQLHSLKLSANVDGDALEPETYNAPGNYTYRRELPSKLVDGDSVRVDFSLDKAIPPGNPDIRELGIVVLSIGLQTR